MVGQPPLKATSMESPSSCSDVNRSIGPVCDLFKIEEKNEDGIRCNLSLVNVQFLFNYKPEWQGSVTLVKQRYELKGTSSTANPLALLLNNNQFTILQTILLKTLNIPPPDRNSLPETEEKQLYLRSLKKDWDSVFTMQNMCDVQGMSETKTGTGFSLSQGKDVIVGQVDQDEIDDVIKNVICLLSLIQKLNVEIDDSKNRNKFLESSNKELVDKLKGEIKDFKTKNKSLESSNNHFKEANNELSKTNQLMFNDIKKFQAGNLNKV
ncbi:hypothetical protein Tco_0804274 [Tanacetum coccineum]|uniref:Uncharacterized protein n=1 Tax=Tanacetum coccineum TaxID=301880 RepID=A0ABQ5A6Q1_9ASTR